jgi:hypothetical protein
VEGHGIVDGDRPDQRLPQVSVCTPVGLYPQRRVEHGAPPAQVAGWNLPVQQGAQPVQVAGWNLPMLGHRA